MGLTNLTPYVRVITISLNNLVLLYWVVWIMYTFWC